MIDYLHTVNRPNLTATRYQLVAQLSLWEGLRVVQLIYVLVELIPAWISGNGFTLIVT